MLRVENVSKVFRLYERPSDRLLEALPFAPKRAAGEFWALREINLSVARGEVLALTGPNGSGKSTLLQILCGIVRPSEGRVSAGGRIAALLELGAGFNPEFTGRENVFLNAEILGLSRARIERVFPEIERFAEVGEFLDRPMKEYSTGMHVRLAFAAAIHVDPEILIVDEALAVGDAIFANRCIRKFDELKKRGVTIVFVSHDLGLVKRLADRAVLLNAGRIAACGNPGDVVNRYVGLVHARERGEQGGSAIEGRGSYRHGDGASRILSVDLRGQSGEALRAVEHGARVSIRVRALARQDLDEPVVGVLIRSRLGTDVFGTNTRIEGLDLGRIEAGRTFEVEFAFECLLTRQEYTITAATQYRGGQSQDWIDDAVSFAVIDARDIAGLASFRTEVSWRMCR